MNIFVITHSLYEVFGLTMCVMGLVFDVAVLGLLGYIIYKVLKD